MMGTVLSPYGLPREVKIYAYSAPGTGGKEGEYMKKERIIYSNAPADIAGSLKRAKVVADFLPPPEKLIRKEPKVKITITLNSGSIEFFKESAKRNNVKYQTMINEVLDKYVQKYREKAIV
jgi:predicted DNA binding CopG/RHH family protein